MKNEERFYMWIRKGVNNVPKHPAGKNHPEERKKNTKNGGKRNRRKEKYSKIESGIRLKTSAASLRVC